MCHLFEAPKGNISYLLTICIFALHDTFRLVHMKNEMVFTVLSYFANISLKYRCVNYVSDSFLHPSSAFVGASYGHILAIFLWCNEHHHEN